jgi:membrane protease YdiL (CAAX protease family)
MDEPKERLFAEPEAGTSSAPAAPAPPSFPPAPPPPPFAHELFFSQEQGLRPGWRFALYVIMGMVVFFSLSTFYELWSPAGLGVLWLRLLGELQYLISGFVPALILARLERRSFNEYGLPLELAFGKLSWLGALWGFLSLSCLLLLMRGAGLVSFAGLAVHGVRALKFAAFYSVMFLAVALFEEFSVRGYPLFTLTQAMGFWPAAVFMSALFGAIHLGNSGESWIGVLGAASIGFFFCLTLRRTGNLWFAVGFHAVWDWAETFFYAVPDSGQMFPGHLLRTSFHGPTLLTGGTVGPEGSVLMFVVVAGTWIAFDRLYPEAKYPGMNSAFESRTPDPSLRSG